MDLKELMKNKDLVLSWMEDEESEFIFERRCEYTKARHFDLSNPNDYMLTRRFKPINDIVENYVPEFEQFKKFYKLIDNRNIYIWGAGVRMHVMMNYMDLAPNVNLCGIIDASETKQNTVVKLGGSEIKISAPSDISFQNDDFVIVTAKSLEIVNAITSEIKAKGLSSDNIIVFSDYYGEELENRQYFDDMIKCGDNEVFIDGGVFDLGTTLNFFKKYRNNASDIKALSFEPDPVSFKNCEKARASYPDCDIELINAALYSDNTTLKFTLNTIGCSSAFDNDGFFEVNAVSLDSYTDSAVTFIKMDVEGAELDALKGCERIITQYKPKLAICVYHKPEDIIEIPMYIKALVPEYKLYMRHYSYDSRETVLYALPY